MVVLCYEEGNEYAGGGQAGIDRRIDMEYNRKWLDFSYIYASLNTFFLHFFLRRGCRRPRCPWRAYRGAQGVSYVFGGFERG